MTVIFRSLDLNLAPAELGWDTATAAIGGGPFELELRPELCSLPCAAAGTNIALSVADSMERLSKSAAVVDATSGEVSWTLDQLRARGQPEADHRSACHCWPTSR